VTIDLMINSLLDLLGRIVLGRHDVHLPVRVEGTVEPLATSGLPALGDGVGLQVGRQLGDGADDLDRNPEVLPADSCPDIEYKFTCLRFSERTSFYPAGYDPTQK
jgi:hypothetical protein